MQSWMALLVAGMLIGPITGATVASADTPSVSSETQSAVDAAHTQWLSGLGVRDGCSSGASIVFEQLDGRRGEYRTRSATVVVDPTDDIAGMAQIVIHELSHHTFLACGVFADAEFTEAFYAAQGLPAGRDWFDYSAGWGATPAEHFAEAMAVTISGSGQGGIAVGAETKAIIARWLSGAAVATAESDTYEPVPYATDSASDVSTEDGGRTDAPSDVPEPRSEAAAPASTADIATAAAEVIKYSKVLWLHFMRVV